MHYLYEMETVKDQIIIKEGDSVDKVYIIKEGEFSVCKKLVQKQKKEDGNI
mgnify:CR=1 FL=1